MLVDFLNCLLEFASFAFIYLSFRLRSARPFGVVIFALLSLLASLFFVLVPLQSLAFNMAVFCAAARLSFRGDDVFDGVFFALLSFIGVIALQFTLYAFLPVDYLQTGPGNMAGNAAMLIVSITLFLNSWKRGLCDVLSNFAMRFRVMLVPVLLGLLLLGRVYLSRLAEIWSYLPGTISLLVLALIIASATAYILYQRSAELLEARAFRRSIRDSQDMISAMRLQLHDHKHHISHLRDMVSFADDLAQLKRDMCAYIDQMDGDRANYEMLLALDSTVLRAFLFGCLRRCEANRVRLLLEVPGLIPEFPLKDYQFVEVAENLFSNALEHNLSLDEERRYIRITLSSDDGVQVFSIENPSDNVSLPIEDLYIANLTTKADGHQGLGLPSIRRTLAENDIHFSGMRNYGHGSIIFSVTYDGGGASWSK